MEPFAQCVNGICTVEYISNKGGKKIMTNREWLESLSDEELAETLYSCTVCARKNTRFCCDNIEKTCSKGVQEWLKQEHKE